MALQKQIKIDSKLKEKLNKLKLHPRETYNDVLNRLLSNSQTERRSS